MYDVMQGVLVVEVSEHTFMPAAGMALADWGADVIKIERTTGGGDPMRSLNIPNLEAGGFNPYFEAGNRGKRSVTVDISAPAGAALVAVGVVTSRLVRSKAAKILLHLAAQDPAVYGEVTTQGVLEVRRSA